MLHDKFNLINITSDVPWSTMWKRNQIMMEKLSRSRVIDRVIFINPENRLGDLAFNFRAQFSDTNHKEYRHRWKAIAPRRVSKKIYAFTPLYFLPFTGRSDRLSRLQTLIHYKIINSLLDRRKRIVFLNDFNYGKQHKKLVELLIKGSSLLVYDWSDDFVEFSKDASEREKVGQTCEAYMRRADVVLAVNDDLAKRAKRLNSKVYTIANATCFENMSRAAHEDFEMPPSLRSLSRPILGYIGWMTRVRMDVEILNHLATLHPEWTIVLIGPAGRAFTDIFRNTKNIIILPPVAYYELPRYMKFFDVCLLPHNVNDHTRGNNPIKLYDYLSTGKPIVSTPVSGVEAFDDLVYIASGPHQFNIMIEKALQEKEREIRQKRIEKARANSWNVRVEQILDIMGRCLTPENQDAFEDQAIA